MSVKKLQVILAKLLPLFDARHSEKYREYVCQKLSEDNYIPFRERFSTVLTVLKLKDAIKTDAVIYTACALLIIDIKEIIAKHPEHTPLLAEWIDIYWTSGLLNKSRPWIPVEVEIMLLHKNLPLYDIDALKKVIDNTIMLLRRNYYAAVWDRFRGRISKDALRVVHNRLYHTLSVLDGKITDPATAFNLCAPVTIDIKTAIKDEPSQRYLLGAWIEVFRSNGYTMYHPVYEYPILPK